MDILKRNNVHVQGNSDGPVMLFAHGFGCNQAMWDRVAPAFASSHRQVLFDYVGSGKSDITAFDAGRYSSLDGYAQDILDVCDALGLSSGVTLVAHSVSCSVGMLASIARPGLFDAMVFVGPSPCFVNHPPDYVGGFAHEDLEGLLALMDQNYIGWANYLAPVVARVFAKATFFADNRADLPKVACRSLILQHKQDALAPVQVGEYLHKNLRNSTLQVLDVAGHCSHMSDPELVIAAMRTFLPAH